MSSKKFRIVHRIPNSNILIDYWKPVSQEKYHRFMTFLKIDINDAIKEICESTYTVYTSLFNKWYLITYYQISEDRLIHLRPNETRTIVDRASGTTFSVTAFDANYYTGSLMFLFQGPFGNILYTGFFRPPSIDPILQNPVLESVISKRELDTAFIDNTYAAEHCKFPTRKEVLNRIIMCLKQHPNHQISISGKRLGKEEILLEIAKALDEKICVTEEKFVILSRLNVQNYFTTDKKKSRIYACDFIINPKQCMRRQAQNGPQIIILLTAYYQCNRAGENGVNIPNLHIFPYSGHCSHSELKRFIEVLRPRKIQPIIKFEDDALPNSIIPQSLHELCSMPPPPLPSYGKHIECSTCKDRIVRPISVLSNDMSEKKQVEPGTSTNATINEIEYLDNIDQFLHTVSEANNLSNASVTLNTSDMPYQSSIGEISNSLIDDILSTSHTSDVSLYNEASVSVTSDVTLYNETSVSNSMVQKMPQFNPVRNPTPCNNFQGVEFMHVFNQGDFSTAENINEFTATSSKPANENIISTSSIIVDNTEDMDLTNVVSSPQSTVYSTNYAENEIAENIISSTNNDNLCDINFPSSDGITERSNEDETNISMNARIGLSTELKHGAIRNVENLEKEPTRESSFEAKTYDTKSIQTDLTNELISKLLEQVSSDYRNTTLMKKYIKNSAPRRKFNLEAYFESLKYDTHSIEDHHKVEELEPEMKKQKINNLAPFKNTLKNCQVEPSVDEKLSNLNGCAILSHPVYRF